MKKNVYRLFFCLLLLFFMGCDLLSEDDSETESTTVTMLPSLGGDISRFVIPSTTDRATTLYYIQTPLIYSFESNSDNVQVGDTFTAGNDVFGTITFTVTEPATGTIQFSGTNSDGTMVITITYYSDSNTFDYVQYSYITDSHDVLGNGNGGLVIAGNIEADGIEIDTDGAFRGEVTSVVIFGFSDNPNSLMFQVSDTGELYHGELTTGNTGTGVAVHCQGTGSSLPDVPAGSAAVKPAVLSDLSDMAAMKRYFTDITYDTFAGSVTMEESSALYYRIGQNNAVECDGCDDHSAADGDGNTTYYDGDITTIADFKAYMGAQGLTVWASVTGL